MADEVEVKLESSEPALVERTEAAENPVVESETKQSAQETPSTTLGETPTTKKSETPTPQGESAAMQDSSSVEDDKKGVEAAAEESKVPEETVVKDTAAPVAAAEVDAHTATPAPPPAEESPAPAVTETPQVPAVAETPPAPVQVEPTAPTSNRSVESRPSLPNNNTHNEAALSTTNHVYIHSEEYAWIPARVEKTEVVDGVAKAHVVIPEYKDERSIQSDGGRRAKRFKKDVISLEDYPNHALPMQNVDEKGNLKEVEDMVDLPFLHEVRLDVLYIGSF